ncbi:MAG: hypothetical protein LBJ20_07960 [Candidatus Methanoplasma sp.]|nr:hypothetical protein [Candidatus Methanoplasma sp.]
MDNLISGLDNDLLNVAGQIEWFDLINETILAFLIVPLYFVFNRVTKNKDEFKSRIMQLMVAGFTIYCVVSLFIYLYANSLSSYMGAPDESIFYLQLETIGFVLEFVSSFLYVVFVVQGKWKYIVALLIAKVAMLSIGNLILIPDYGVIGLAETNIIVSAVLSIVSLILLCREKLLTHRFKFEKETFKEWGRTGLFSGGQIFLDNIIYMLIVVKIINEVSSVGIYWLANNFIWGWLLIPIVALVEIVKRDYYKGYRRIYNYLLYVAIIALIWLCSVPLWDVMFVDIIHAQDPDGILNILYLLVPFYIAYALAAVFDGILVSVGKTWYLFGISITVNIGYYGIVYSLFLTGYFTASIDFVIMMFGFGMVVHLIFSILFYLHSKRKVPMEAYMQTT